MLACSVNGDCKSKIHDKTADDRLHRSVWKNSMRPGGRRSPVRYLDWFLIWKEGKRTMAKQNKWNVRLAAGWICLAIAGTALFSIVQWQVDKERTVTKQEPVTVTMVYAYQNARWSQGIQTIAEEFQRQHENIRLDLQVQYEDNVYEEILAKLQARGQMGDIIQLKTPGRYAKEGLLAPIEESAGNLVEHPYILGGNVYGVEALGTTNGILYNRRMFESLGLEEPSDYEAFLNICEALKSQGITPIGVAGGDLWHLEFWVNHFFRTDMGGQTEDWLADRREEKVQWQSREGEQMLAHLKQLFSSGYFNEDWQTAKDGNLAYRMSQGKTAMMYTGSWTARELQNLNPEIELGWFFLPDEEGNVFIPQNQDVYWSLTAECQADPEVYEAAICFLKFFYQEDVYSRLCESTFGFPVTVMRGQEKSQGIRQEIKEKFCVEQPHSTVYIGNEDTPQGFEEMLLQEIKTLSDPKADVAATAKKLDLLWDEYQNQERM